MAQVHEMIYMKMTNGEYIYGSNLDIGKYLVNNIESTFFVRVSGDSMINVGIYNNDIMVDFHEKISNPPSNLANGAVYLFDNNFIDWLEGNQFNGNDFSLHVLPLLKSKVKIWRTNEYFIDIGTPEALNYARSLCKIKNS